MTGHVTRQASNLDLTIYPETMRLLILFGVTPFGNIAKTLTERASPAAIAVDDLTNARRSIDVANGVEVMRFTD